MFNSFFLSGLMSLYFMLVKENELKNGCKF